MKIHSNGYGAMALIVTLSAAVNVANAQSTIIHAGTLLSVPGERPSSEQSLVVRDGRVAEIRDGYVDGSAIGDSSATIIDLSDRFVMPGMMDMHVHLTGYSGARPDFSRTSSADLALIGADNAHKTLLAGITLVRDVGAGSAEAIVALRDAVERGAIPGPRIVAAGRALSATAGHADVRGLREDIAEQTLSTGVCDGVEGCRQAVRNQYKAGADVIKLNATGGGADPNGQADSAPEMFDDELQAIVETAHRLGMKVAAHAHGTAGIQAALRAGVDSVEHASWIDAETVKLFSQTDTFLVPTLYLQDYFLASDSVSEAAKTKVRTYGAQTMATMYRAHQEGVVIAMGTDSGVSPHGENAGELLQYVEMGLTPMEAIVTTTRNAAALLGMESDLGTLEPGKYADVIATGGSPLEDISEVKRVTFVMKNGEIYKHE